MLKFATNRSCNADKICYTFDSYFCEQNGGNINNLKDKTNFIEEFSMFPTSG